MLNRGEADCKKSFSGIKIVRPVSAKTKRPVLSKACKEAGSESELKKVRTSYEATGAALRFYENVASSLLVGVASK